MRGRGDYEGRVRKDGGGGPARLEWREILQVIAGDTPYHYADLLHTTLRGFPIVLILDGSSEIGARVRRNMF